MDTIRYERQGPLGVARLSKARGNAIDAALVEDLIKLTAEAAADDGLKALMLASAHPKLFSPGLDLVSLVEYDRAGMRHFMGRFAEMLWALYAFLSLIHI